jgi:hypothetical protein
MQFPVIQNSLNSPVILRQRAITITAHAGIDVVSACRPIGRACPQPTVGVSAAGSATGGFGIEDWASVGAG